MTKRQAILLALSLVIPLGGMAFLAWRIHGDDHWMLSAEDWPGGMTLRIGTAGGFIPPKIETPDYVIDVTGYTIGRDLAPIPLDGDTAEFPAGWTRVFLDTTVLPGSCRLQAGPVFLDFHRARLEANEAPCQPGGRIAVTIKPGTP